MPFHLPEPHPPRQTVEEFIAETNEFLADLQWVERDLATPDTTRRYSLPAAERTQLSGVTSRWDITWGKPHTRWNRLKWRWQNRAERLRNAWAVLKGEKEVAEDYDYADRWDDYDDD